MTFNAFPVAACPHAPKAAIPSPEFRDVSGDIAPATVPPSAAGALLCSYCHRQPVDIGWFCSDPCRDRAHDLLLDQGRGQL